MSPASTAPRLVMGGECAPTAGSGCSQQKGGSARPFLDTCPQVKPGTGTVVVGAAEQDQGASAEAWSLDSRGQDHMAMREVV